MPIGVARFSWWGKEKKKARKKTLGRDPLTLFTEPSTLSIRPQRPAINNAKSINLKYRYSIDTNQEICQIMKMASLTYPWVLASKGTSFHHIRPLHLGRKELGPWTFDLARLFY